MSYSLCLPCGGSPCQVGVITRSGSLGIYNLQTPVCCKSGEYVKSGYCGCCLECAKDEGEQCGGEWGEKGKCGSGLICEPSLTNLSNYECMKITKAKGNFEDSKSGEI